MPIIDSSKKLKTYGANTNTTFEARAVVKSGDDYWLKVKMGDDYYDSWGYVKYSGNYSINKTTRIESIINNYGKYHINLLTYNEFDSHPEYQGFLMALADSYNNLNDYIKAGYPFDGFTFMGICAGESSAKAHNTNYGFFGSITSINSKYQTVGDKAVISALKKCNLAFSDSDAEDLIKYNATLYQRGFAFYDNAAKFIGHLELRLKDTEKTSAPWYEPSTNHSSYLKAEANAVIWRRAYNAGKIKGNSDYKFIYNFTVQELIDILGGTLVNNCEIYSDDLGKNSNYTGYGNPNYTWWYD